MNLPNKHFLDFPIDFKQINPILESMQGNRNPFIDNPYLATKIWGGVDAEETWGLLGIDDSVINNIKIYPTLVSERLYVTNVSSSNIDAVTYGISGQEIKANITNNYIEVEALTDGMYFLKIIDDGSGSSFKFIKN